MSMENFNKHSKHKIHRMKHHIQKNIIFSQLAKLAEFFEKKKSSNQANGSLVSQNLSTLCIVRCKAFAFRVR